MGGRSASCRNDAPIDAARSASGAMLRTAMGPAIAARACRPAGDRGDGQSRRQRSGSTGSGDGPQRHRRAPRPRPGRADHPAGREPCADARSIAAARRSSRPSCRRMDGAGERFEGLLPPVVDRALLRDPQARGRGLHPRRLCERRDHGAPRRAAAALGGRRAPQHPRRRRHQLGQDHARQCPARRDRPTRRAGRS